MGEDADRRVIDAGRGAEQDHSLTAILADAEIGITA
jgi:hypothetical protein